MKKLVRDEVQKKTVQNFADYLKRTIFAPTNSVAEIAQLVEHDLAKVGVASSSLVFRSFFKDARMVESVDTRDLKSLGYCGCAGSSPASSTIISANY